MFDRLLKLITNEDLNKIKNTNVLLVGVGGVGGYALEALVRCSIENITIVDSDNVELSNLNRQIISLQSNIGKPKVEVASTRVKDINPNINITTIKEFITKDNIDILFNNNYDYIIDACDTVTTKVLLIQEANKRNINIISCMGTGNRFDPSKVKITDISKTNNDPLAKIMRKLLRDINIKHQKVVFSDELPIKTNDRTPGSTSLVPSVAGIYAASYVINNILNNNN